jgi:hypothetical protein
MPCYYFDSSARARRGLSEARNLLVGILPAASRNFRHLPGFLRFAPCNVWQFDTFINSSVIFTDLRHTRLSTIYIAKVALEYLSQRPAISWLEFHMLYQGILDADLDFCVLCLVVFGTLRHFLPSACQRS